jgi:hypothetical protein
MALDNDAILGVCYLKVSDLQARAAAFGAAQAITGLDSANLKALLANASRQIDAYLGRVSGGFAGIALTEFHQWNPATRRFALNNPPPASVTVCKLHLAANVTEQITLTPVANDSANRPMSWGGLVWNRQTGMMELDTLLTTTLAINQVAALGLEFPFVEIQYTTEGGETAIPSEVALACGYQAAYLAQRNQASAILPGDITSLRTADRSVSRAAPGAAVRQGGSGAGDDLCQQARAVLAPLMRLAVA